MPLVSLGMQASVCGPFGGPLVGAPHLPFSLFPKAHLQLPGSPEWNMMCTQGVHGMGFTPLGMAHRNTFPAMERQAGNAAMKDCPAVRNGRQWHAILWFGHG